MRSSVDLFQHVSMQMKVLDFFGLSFRIPYSKRSVYFWLALLYLISVIVFVYIIPTVTQTAYVVRLIMSGNAEIQDVVSIINLILTESLAFFKLMDMRLRRDKLEQLLDQFTSEEFYYNSPHLQVILKRGVRISRALFVSLLISASIDVLFHVVIVPGIKGFKTLPLNMDLIFFDINDPKYFNLAFAYQVLYKPYMVSSYVVLVTLPWAAMSLTVSQLDILIYNFENMKELVKATRNERGCDENEAFRQIFKRYVKHHSAIKRFIHTLQATFSAQLASSLFLSTGIIGTTAMQIFSIKSPMNNISEVLWVFAYLLIFIYMLFVDSYFGNSITVKCAYISSAIFASPWIDLKIGLKKDLLLFMAWTQQSVVITAAKLVPVSLETFTKVMNWTYKGFAVMNQMKQ